VRCRELRATLDAADATHGAASGDTAAAAAAAATASPAAAGTKRKGELS
jgi:hypothetical protein